jgi:biotin--protein ligase
MKKLLLLFFFIIYTIGVQSLYAGTKNIVYVYKDDGVSNESLVQTTTTLRNLVGNKFKIKTIDAKDIREGSWIKRTVLFVMPGGADVPYTKKLDGLGNKQIKQYVEQGGSFLGICAGSYYASSYVEFDKGGPLEVLGSRELKFFQGKSIGPILAQYDYKTQSGSRAATISTIFDEVPQTVVYYNGGGYFKDANKFVNTRVIATYENDLPAIINISYGQGKVILSGVHFEYDVSLLDRNDKYIQMLISHLAEADESREILLNKVLELLGIFVNKRNIE